MTRLRMKSEMLFAGATFLAISAVFLLIAIPLLIYFFCYFEVRNKQIAILTNNTGQQLTNADEIAPPPDEGGFYRGVQREVLAEGRHVRNPWTWRWDVVQQFEIPQGKLGVRVRLYGDDLGYGEIIARTDDQKGIVPGVLQPGRHAINAWVIGQPARERDNYAEHIELHDPVTVPAGFKGVVTNLSGPMPDDPNSLLVTTGSRGVQSETYEPGTYYVNPYVTRISQVDCRSQRFNLSEGGEMGFPSKDGFWVTLDGIIEFRVMPEMAAQVFVTYNDEANDQPGDARVDEEIIKKVLLPNARSFCRLQGSNHSGREFISGETRIKFQEDFQKELGEKCMAQGIEIIQALITRVNPPQPIADPVQQRQIALQELEQYQKQTDQQLSEQELAIEKATIERKQALVETEQKVVMVVTEAEKEQEVAVVQAKQRLKVAELQLEAAADQAAAVLALGKAEAEVIEFDNAAEAAGWKKAVEAFGGDGHQYARWVLLKKLAPAFQRMMVNTADSPIMDIFEQYESGPLEAPAPGPDQTPVEDTGAESPAPAPENTGAESPAPAPENTGAESPAPAPE